MRISRALVVSAALLAPAAWLATAPASHSAPTTDPCGAVTTNPGCFPSEQQPVSPTAPMFPYSGSTLGVAQTANVGP